MSRWLGKALVSLICERILLRVRDFKIVLLLIYALDKDRLGKQFVAFAVSIRPFLEEVNGNLVQVFDAHGLWAEYDDRLSQLVKDRQKLELLLLRDRFGQEKVPLPLFDYESVENCEHYETGPDQYYICCVSFDGCELFLLLFIPGFSHVVKHTNACYEER